MKIKLIKPQLIGNVNHLSGDVVEVPDSVAKRKITERAAIPFVEQVLEIRGPAKVEVKAK